MTGKKGLIFVGVLTLFVFGPKLYAQDLPPEEIRVTLSQGPTGLIPAGARKASPVKSGVVLFQGDQLITGKKGRLQLATKDGTVLELKEESSLFVEELSKKWNVFRLKIGRLLGRIAKLKERQNQSPYKFKTPVAVASVRGTELALDVNESDELTAGVVEGEVEFERSIGKNAAIRKDEPSVQESSGVATAAAPVAPSSDVVKESEDQVVVKSSEGITLGRGKNFVKTSQIPPLLVGTLDWFKDIRSQIPTFKEQWKDLDAPSLMKLRQGALRDTIQWEIPSKIKDTLSTPSENLKEMPRPGKIDVPKHKIDQP